MKVEVKKDEGKYCAAYSSLYFGFEFIYVENTDRKERQLLFENKLASQGFWMNDRQIANLVEDCFIGPYFPELDGTNRLLINVGDKIIIESYKNRGVSPGIGYTYNEKGMLDFTPEFDRELIVVEDLQVDSKAKADKK